MSVSYNFNKVASVALFALSLMSCAQQPDDYIQENQPLNVAVDDVNTGDKQTVSIEKLEIPSLTFYFGFAETELLKSHNAQIKSLANYLIKSGDIFEIYGCASKKGNADNNFWISHRRATAVLDALENEGVKISKYICDGNYNCNYVQEQSRDVFGEGEDCPNLVNGVEDADYEKRRATLNLNPV